MKNVKLYLWNACGGDGDGYEADFEITDEQYAIIITLLNEYFSQEVIVDEEECKEFTKECLALKAPEIYSYLEKVSSEEILEGLRENLEDFDEDEEGCTLDEYIYNGYEWGFWIASKWVKEIK